MADGVKISQLPGASTPSDSDVVAGVQSGTTKKFSFANIYAWLKARLVPEDIGAVPDSRTVNGKALSSDISLAASDVGARANDWMPTAAQVGARPDTWTPSAQDVGAVPVASVGVAGGVPNLDEIGRVPQNQLPPYPTVPAASTSNPQDLGTASPGLSDNYARADHVHDMPSASDVGALASGGTAVAAGRLANAHYFTASASGWIKFMEITMANNTRQTMILLIESNYSARCGVLRVHTRRTSAGNAFESIGWIASGSVRHRVRWQYSGGTWSLYLEKYDAAEAVYIQIISKSDNSYGTWKADAVAEPTNATNAETFTNIRAIADGLWFPSVAVTAGTAQQILSISDTAINAEYVLARIEWADPSYITDGFTWTTASGSFTLSGTATAATTANVLLLRRSN